MATRQLVSISSQVRALWNHHARVSVRYGYHLPTKGISHKRTLAVKRNFQSTAFVSGRVATTLSEESPTQEPTHPTDIRYFFTPPPSLSSESKEKVDKLFQKIIWLDMVEVHLLTQLVHEMMGGKWSDLQSSAGPVKTVSVSVEANDPGQQPNPLQDLKLVGFDSKSKIKVIKEVRAIVGLGLKEAKELVESAPKLLQKGLKPDQAQELKVRLEAVGAQVELS